MTAGRSRSPYSSSPWNIGRTGLAPKQWRTEDEGGRWTYRLGSRLECPAGPTATQESALGKKLHLFVGVPGDSMRPGRQRSRRARRPESGGLYAAQLIFTPAAQAERGDPADTHRARCR